MQQCSGKVNKGVQVAGDAQHQHRGAGERCMCEED